MEKLLGHEWFEEGEVKSHVERGRTTGSHLWVIENRFHRYRGQQTESDNFNLVASMDPFISVPVDGNEVKRVYVSRVLKYLLALKEWNESRSLEE